MVDNIMEITNEIKLKNPDLTREDTSKLVTYLIVSMLTVLNDVGSSEVFSCKDCYLVIDRDVNGARNIFLKCENSLKRVRTS